MRVLLPLLHPPTNPPSPSSSSPTASFHPTHPPARDQPHLPTHTSSTSSTCYHPCQAATLLHRHPLPATPCPQSSPQPPPSSPNPFPPLSFTPYAPPPNPLIPAPSSPHPPPPPPPTLDTPTPSPSTAIPSTPPPLQSSHPSNLPHRHPLLHSAFPLFFLLLMLLQPPTATALSSEANLLDLNHFVLVTPTSKSRLPLVHAQRQFRAGIRTYTLVESVELADELNNAPESQLFRETYSYYPDRGQAAGSAHIKPGAKIGDNRWMAAPFLAHQYYTSINSPYRWMLFGDDDTVFFLNGMLKLLRPFDHTLPYWVGDHITDWWARFEAKKKIFIRPSELGLSCLPCHSIQAGKILNEKYKGTVLEAYNFNGCPCTRVKACARRVAMCATFPEYAKDPELCSMHDLHHDSARFLHPHKLLRIRDSPILNSAPREEVQSMCDHSWPMGGVGWALSVAMMETVVWNETIKAYIDGYDRDGWSHHAGDWALSLMFNELGFSTTVPDYAPLMAGELLSHNHTVFLSFDESPIVQRPLLHLKGTAQGCKSSAVTFGPDQQEHCKWLVQHAVSAHMGVGHPPFNGSIPMALKMMGSMARSHKAALRMLGEPNAHVIRNMTKFLVLERGGDSYF